jgi:acyl-homoserine-lactone acylase
MVGGLLFSMLAYRTVAAQTPRFDAEIRWTSFGIPHVKATDWGSLGYGFAYATAKDAICTMARDVVMVNGELSRHFGAANGNDASDIFHRAVLDSSAVHNFTRGQSVKSNQFADGYVAGYNRYLRDHAAELPTSCRGASWVQPVSADDVTRLSIGVGIRYGLARYQAEIANAAPPGAGTRSVSTDFALPMGEGSNLSLIHI